MPDLSTVCDTCEWEEENKCRKNPPSIIVINGKIVTVWPEVDPLCDWCGEHQDIKR